MFCVSTFQGDVIPSLLCVRAYVCVFTLIPQFLMAAQVSFTCWLFFIFYKELSLFLCNQSIENIKLLTHQKIQSIRWLSSNVLMITFLIQLCMFESFKFSLIKNCLPALLSEIRKWTESARYNLMLKGSCKGNWALVGLMVDHDFTALIQNFLIDRKNLIIFRYTSFAFK